MSWGLFAGPGRTPGSAPQTGAAWEGSPSEGSSPALHPTCTSRCWFMESDAEHERWRETENGEGGGYKCGNG